MGSHWDIFFFDTLNHPVPGKDRLEQEAPERRDMQIYCAHCRVPVTSKHDQLEISGVFEHRFVNPAGIVFTIGCFSRAPGCRLEGNPVLEHTWFAGHRWCYAVCSECLTHLGWHYEGGDHEFFGLILDRLKFST